MNAVICFDLSLACPVARWLWVGRHPRDDLSERHERVILPTRSEARSSAALLPSRSADRDRWVLPVSPSAGDTVVRRYREDCPQRAGVARPFRTVRLLRHDASPGGRSPPIVWPSASVRRSPDSGAEPTRRVPSGHRQRWRSVRSPHLSDCRLVANGFHEPPRVAMTNSVPNSGRDSTRPPGPVTDRYRDLHT